MPILSFKRIIAACCYLQYYQALRKVSIDDVQRICDKMDVKMQKAIDIVTKWSNKLAIEASEPKQSRDHQKQHKIYASPKDEFEVLRLTRN